MDEELFAGPEGVLLADSGDCACFIVSRLEVAADEGAGVAERVEVDDQSARLMLLSSQVPLCKRMRRHVQRRECY